MWVQLQSPLHRGALILAGFVLTQHMLSLLDDKLVEGRPGFSQKAGMAKGCLWR